MRVHTHVYTCIVCIHTNIDFIRLFAMPMSSLVVYCIELPKVGQTITGTSFSKNFGGKGANQAVMATRLGVKTTMCGMVGRDTFGDDYKEQLRKEGCGVEHFLQTAEDSTGIASIAVDNKGQNTIVIVSGANLAISDEDISSFRPVLETSCIVLCQNEIKLTRTIEALQLAKGYGCLTIFNPAPASLDCVDALPYADIVCPNETELALLTALPTETDAEVIQAANALMENSRKAEEGAGCSLVIVSLGARGACVVSALSAAFVPAPVVEAIDTVGAGDCFLGSLAGYLSREVPLLQAVAQAVQCASVSVTRRGAQGSYPNLTELDGSLVPPPKKE
jgi:ribokinase